ncbi:GNAT family N-acetyltransferase [Kitasatospora mediocidica]|uniref:GNAT family N-acetyltransferase n=1 Tax=Kitasatospora mediocidica TaxID=58352 RepID=UPI00068B98DF|nr:GNAT family N-acetyltransferase [Kitasatospora mediocidica]
MIKLLDTLPTAPPALVLRPWEQDDVPALLAAHQDPQMRQWLVTHLDDVDDATRWVAEQEGARQRAERFSFAVVEPVTGDAASHRLVGQVVLKGAGGGASAAEVGYWTVAAARGRGLAGLALRSLTDWAFATFAADGLTRLELFHQVGNEASCRVAEKSGYPLVAVLPPLPPYPQNGHLHVLRRGEGD